MLESNAFSPVADEAEFREKHWIEGDAIVDDARSATPRDPGGFTGFCRAMDESGPWAGDVRLHDVGHDGLGGAIDMERADRAAALDKRDGIVTGTAEPV